MKAEDLCLYLFLHFLNVFAFSKSLPWWWSLCKTFSLSFLCLFFALESLIIWTAFAVNCKRSYRYARTPLEQKSSLGYNLVFSRFFCFFIVAPPFCLFSVFFKSFVWLGILTDLDSIIVFCATSLLFRF